MFEIQLLWLVLARRRPDPERGRGGTALSDWSVAVIAIVVPVLVVCYVLTPQFYGD
jgi:hypothetical protein